MLIDNLLEYAYAALKDRDFGVIVYSVETGEEIATTYAVAVEISEYGELMLCIAV